MHESSLIPALMRAIEHAADGAKVTRIRLTVGEFAGISADHLREHLIQAGVGTAVADAALDITLLSDPGDPLAYGVWVQSLDVRAEAPPC